MTHDLEDYDLAELREAIIELSQNGPVDWQMSAKELSNFLFEIAF